MKILGLAVLVSLMTLSLTGCVTSQPQCIDNICSMFNEYPDWYCAAKDSEKKWGAPIPVQMAIIHQESSFKANAKPARRWFLGCIPCGRPSSAYGYTQAINNTWSLYKKNTGHHCASRKNFKDSIDFVGWYIHTAKRQLGIAPSNAYALYLAYHEGLQGYAHRTYFRKPWLMKVARRVSARARLYQLQLQAARR